MNMLKINVLKLAPLIGALYLAASPVHALQMTFFGEDLGLGEGTPLLSFPTADAAEAAFLANLVGTGTEDFESFAGGTGAPLGLIFPGAGAATLTGTGAIADVPSGTTNGVGRYATSGTRFWEAGSSATEFGIQFANPIAAFGFYGIDIGDFNGQVTVTTLNGGDTLYNVGNTIGSPGGSVLFWGVIDTVNPFTSVSFGNTNPGIDFFGFDDMTIGSVEQVQIPEPATLVLFTLGLLGLGVRRRKA